MSWWKKVKKALSRVFAIVMLVIAIVCLVVLAVFTGGAACALIGGAAFKLATFTPWLATASLGLLSASSTLELMLVLSAVALVGQAACICGAFLAAHGWPAASTAVTTVAAGDRGQWTRRPYISAGALVVQAARSSLRQVFVEHKGVEVNESIPKTMILAAMGLSI